METELLINLGILIFFSILGGIISTKLKQPFVLGLLLVGTLIGPNALGLIANPELIDIFIEFGAILFLFIVGMEFSVNKIMGVGIKAIIVSVFKVGIMFFVGFSTIVLLGFDIATATFTGVMLSFSSTMIIMNVLKQKKLIHRKEIPLLITVLVLEDLFGVIALIFFKAMKTSGGLTLINSVQNLIISLTILILAYIIISKFAEKLITWIHSNTNDEMILFTGLLLCAGFSLLAYYLDLSPSAGAFLAGSIISNFKEAKSFHKSIQPYNFMFTSFFFISMGTMINLGAILSNYWVILVLLISIFIGLIFAVGLVTKIFANYNSESAVFSTIVMLPPGVFSLLMAKESLAYGVSIDLISVVSIIILILSVVLSILSVKTNVLLEEVNKRRNKDSVSNKVIKAISEYFETLFDELNSDNAYTKSVKKSSGKLFKQLCFFIFSAIILKEILQRVFNYSIFYFILVVSILILSLQLVYLIKFFNNLRESIISLMSSLDGGIKVKKIRNGTNHLLFAVILLFIGIFFPLIIFMLGWSKLFLFISVLILIWSTSCFYNSGKSFNRLTYYSTGFKYKKFNYDSAKLWSENNKV